ncbi:MAG TPA: alpha/beta fold hydrolase [Nevskiaceae bacterium]|nr:alpha/beta fold hydrolase [Nevskiaceae bacterium]
MRRLAIAALALLLGACNHDSNDGIYQVDGEPALDVPRADLEAGLKCLPYTHPDKPPVLLVHGTFTNANEQYDWTYIPLLDQRGYDVCAVTYPDRGLGDQQVSAEYVVYALRKMHADSGRRVAMIGHSQGATMPRWALKWWPSARNAVQTFVMQAGPNHGTTVAASTIPVVGEPAAFWQFSPASNFVAALNSGDETPGDIAYTNLYTTFDELVEPSAPIPTAALDWQQGNPKVANILLQDVCAGRVVDHVTIGTTDALSFALALDAVSHGDVANVERAGGSAGLCGLLQVVPDQQLESSAVLDMLSVLPTESTAPPDPQLVTEEPPLKPYAQ